MAGQKRQISDADKHRVLERQGLTCFIDSHPVDSADELEFDHIRPFAEGGPSHVDNIAAVCRKHNREKRTLSLGEYRDRVELRRFFEGVKKRRLDDLLEAKLGKGGYGQPLNTKETNGALRLFLDEGVRDVPVQQDPATGEAYFFSLLPVRNLRNDVELQPRALEPERLWELYRELRIHTQLAPAVCRLVGNRVLLFDGQHKAAAQVWAGRSFVDCKVYLEPEIRRLKETNLTAHDKLRQMPFYTSTLLEKYADLAHEDWTAFLQIPGPKTEAAFVDFMKAKVSLSRAGAIKRVRSVIYRDILEHPDNRLRDYITEENRSRKNPLTMNRLEKTFFAEFIAPPPLEDEFESESYHRDEERESVVYLLNSVVDKALDGKWDPDRGDSAHKKAERLFSAGALRAWVPFLRDALAPALQLFQSEERRRIFYRELTDANRKIVGELLERLLSHKVWEDPAPELNNLRYDNAERAKATLNEAGLTPAWILGQS